MTSRKLIVTALTLLLCSCASAPPRLQYYLLHQPQSSGGMGAANPVLTVSLTSLQLPDYLKQRGLVMQTSATQLHVSSLHLWAEPLATDFTQALRNSLLADSAVLIAPVDVADSNTMPRLSILIEDLITTYQGEVVLKGQYWITTVDNAAQGFLFDFRLPLEEDGFSHSVNQMQTLVEKLGEDIGHHLAEQ